MEKISKLTTYGAVKAALGELPVKENDFYDQSIKRIMSDESQAEQALRILAWILCAKTPMSLWDMRYASIIVPGNYSMNFEEFAPSEEDLVNCCHGLVVILPETRTLAFTHPTIKDYLESARKRVFPHDAEVIISSTCLTYLASDYLHSNMDQDLGIFPLFEYATSTWVEHVRGNYETEVLDFIIKLLERNPSLVLFKELENISLQKQDYFYPSPKATVHYPLTLDRDGVWIACKRGLEGTVKKLLERGAFWGAIEEPKCSNFTWGCREPILVAVAHKYPAVVQVLLEFGADANTRHHETGWTGLHLVAEQRRLWRSVQLLQVLLRGGADIEAEGNDGKTPLHVASYRGRANVVDFLLREGASIDARDKLGDTPLHTAGRRYKDNHAKISLLLERGSDVNAKNENGETVLHLAVAWSPVDVIRLLLETDVQIEAIDNKGQTALHIAAAGINQSRCKDRILSLLERGANVEARDKDARTPLHIAAQHGWVEAVEILLGKEPVIDAKEKLGRKAVDIARARLEGVEGPNPDANRTAQV
jgi:ankyrin repeat protein